MLLLTNSFAFPTILFFSCLRALRTCCGRLDWKQSHNPVLFVNNCRSSSLATFIAPASLVRVSSSDFRHRQSLQFVGGLQTSSEKFPFGPEPRRMLSPSFGPGRSRSLWSPKSRRGSFFRNFVSTLPDSCVCLFKQFLTRLLYTKTGVPCFDSQSPLGQPSHPLQLGSRPGVTPTHEQTKPSPSPTTQTLVKSPQTDLASLHTCRDKFPSKETTHAVQPPSAQLRELSEVMSLPQHAQQARQTVITSKDS